VAQVEYTTYTEYNTQSTYKLHQIILAYSILRQLFWVMYQDGPPSQFSISQRS